MAKENNPYQRRWEDYKSDHLAVYNLSQNLELKDVDPIYITSDGKIIARGFIDENDDLELSLDSKKNIIYSLNLDSTTDKIHSINSSQTYKTSGVMQETITEGFKGYSIPSDLYSNKDSLKFNNLNKTTKKLINSIASPFSFHFTHEDGSGYAMPSVRGSWISPFNYDVCIEPDPIVKSVKDVVVVKSGEYHYLPMSPAMSLISLIYYSSGVSGNIYMETTSTPSHARGHDPNIDLKSIKIPRSGNSNRTPDTTEVTPIGPIGVFKNGVLLYSYKTDDSYSGLGAYNNNSIVTDWANKDSCGGYLSELNLNESGDFPINTYHYKSAPICLYDTGNTTGHSELLGYAFDGYPIYGPYGYGTASDSASAPRLMTPSYRLKPITNRPNGPDYSGEYISGYFVEDFEYVSGLGDLDEHNGRVCATPEYPNGTYAYFSTVTTGASGKHTPSFPYVIGNKLYGKVEKQNWTGVAQTEPAVFVTGEGNENGIDVGLFSENIYGLKNVTRGGIKNETIIYVSPHELASLEGVFLDTGSHQYNTSSGTSAMFSGSLFSGVGNSSVSGQTNKFIASTRIYKYPTSHNCQFLPVALSGNMPYLRVDPDTSVSQTLTGHSSIVGTNFHNIYSGHKSGFQDKIYTGVWDGVIPSGVPFKIEVWSFNGSLDGLEGKFKIRPTTPHPAVSGKVINVAGVFVGEGGTIEEAKNDMIQKGKKQIFKEIDSFLINSGIMDGGRRLSRYAKMISKNK